MRGRATHTVMPRAGPDEGRGGVEGGGGREEVGREGGRGRREGEGKGEREVGLYGRARAGLGAADLFEGAGRR